MINPLEQFALKYYYILFFYKYDFSLTNAVLSFILTTFIIIILYFDRLKYVKLKPDKKQILSEITLDIVEKCIFDIIGFSSKKFISLVLTLFIFIFINNIISIIPIFFSCMSHFIVTGTLSLLVFFIVTYVGLINKGMNFFKMFLPPNIPMFFSPIIILIEIFTYISRPISQSLRLASNIIAGHVVLEVLAVLISTFGYFGFLPFLLLTVLYCFEIIMSVFQAYIFIIVTCTYLNIALKSH